MSRVMWIETSVITVVPRNACRSFFVLGFYNFFFASTLAFGTDTFPQPTSGPRYVKDFAPHWHFEVFAVRLNHLNAFKTSSMCCK